MSFLKIFVGILEGGMKRKVYWKDLFASFTHIHKDIFSHLTLMLLGKLGLGRPKVTTPNMPNG